MHCCRSTAGMGFSVQPRRARSRRFHWSLAENTLMRTRPKTKIHFHARILGITAREYPFSEHLDAPADSPTKLSRLFLRGISVGSSHTLSFCSFRLRHLVPLPLCFGAIRWLVLLRRIRCWPFLLRFQRSILVGELFLAALIVHDAPLLAPPIGFAAFHDPAGFVFGGLLVLALHPFLLLPGPLATHGTLLLGHFEPPYIGERRRGMLDVPLAAEFRG